MCFVWISEQTAIISLYSINWLVFITEAECVYCAVWTQRINEIQFYFSFTGPTSSVFNFEHELSDICDTVTLIICLDSHEVSR
jgi:hypothetical protein